MDASLAVGVHQKTASEEPLGVLAEEWYVL